MMTGCDGGGGGGGDDSKKTTTTSTSTTTATANRSITGYWTGYVTDDSGVGSASTSLTLTQNGTALSGFVETYAVTGTFDGTSISLTITPYTKYGVTMTGTVTASYNGTYIVNGRITLNFSTGVTQRGSISKMTRSGSQNLADLNDGFLNGAFDEVAVKLLSK